MKVNKMTTPDYHSHEEYQNREKKLKELKELGIDPFPHVYKPSDESEILHKKFENNEIGSSESAAEGKTDKVKVAGRIVLFRSMGKNAFVQLQDGSGRIQIMFNKELTHLENYNASDKNDSFSDFKILEKKLDLGDIIGVEGHLFRTQKGELTVFAKNVIVG